MVADVHDGLVIAVTDAELELGMPDELTLVSVKVIGPEILEIVWLPVGTVPAGTVMVGADQFPEALQKVPASTFPTVQDKVLLKGAVPVVGLAVRLTVGTGLFVGVTS